MAKGCFLIVNADDFGYDESRTNAILAAWRGGIVTHATVMVTMPDCSRAVALAKQAGFDKALGLHVNLTEGCPLTDNIKRHMSFCDENGFFNHAFLRTPLKRFLLTSQERKAVSEEVEAQFQRFMDCGLTPGHVDSHHHVHFNYSIASVVVPIARKYGFKTIRIGYNLYVPSRLVRVYRELMNIYYRKRLGTRSRYFAGYNPVIDLSTLSAATEIMVHPRYMKDGIECSGGELFDYDTKMDEVVAWLSKWQGKGVA